MNTPTYLCRAIAVIVVFSAAASLSLAQESLSKERPKPKAPEAPKPAMVEKRALSIGLVTLFNPVVTNDVETGFKLPTVSSCCPGYEGTSGSGIAIGAELMLPLSDALELGARIAYQTSSATFSAVEPTTVRVGNSAVKTTIDHSLSTNVSSLFLEPTLNYLLTRGIYLSGGLRLGTITGGMYDQVEKFTDASIPYDFETNRNAKDQEIPFLSGFQLGAVIGLRTLIELGPSLSVMPEISYAPMFTSIVSDASWTASPLRIGASILLNVTKLEAVSTPIAP